jgi:hypothetical protein
VVDLAEIDWLVDEYTNEAKGIAWDTCHKIYVLMDDEQVALQLSYGYGNENDPDSLITSEQMTGDEMKKQVLEWYQNSCGLRFIYAISSNESFGNGGFKGIVEQFYDEEDEDDD